MNGYRVVAGRQIRSSGSGGDSRRRKTRLQTAVRLLHWEFYVLATRNGTKSPRRTGHSGGGQSGCAGHPASQQGFERPRFLVVWIEQKMSITKERKQALIGEHRREQADTGSPEVQIAILTARVAELTEHLRTHSKDFQSSIRRCWMDRS